MREFEVPGVGLAIVKDGRIVVARGFGVRRLGAEDRVDGRTSFGIASLSKAFTAVALALLVEEGKVEWDAPVVRYLPWFQMSDPWVTREITVRDLIAHRSGLGLGAGDLLWWPTDTCDRTEFVRRIRYLQPAGSFRNTFIYSTTPYVIAGALIEAVTGRTWETFVAERVVAKVGMRDADTRLSRWGRGRNAAEPHAPIGRIVRPIAPLGGDVANPGAGIAASPEDMAAWLRVLLAGGKLEDGSRLYSEKTAHELWSVVTPLRVAAPSGAGPLVDVAPTMRGYGLGFFVQDYRARRLLVHTGSWAGYVSFLGIVPDLGLGVVVLTNQESDEARRAILYSVLDRYLGAPAVSWVEVLKGKAARDAADAAEAERRQAAGRAPGSGPSLPLSSYAGAYADAWYGDVLVTGEAKGLVIRFPGAPLLVGDLEHWQQDTFVARWRDPELRADAYVTFALGPEGTVEQVKMKAVSPATDYSFDFHDLHLRPRRAEASK